MLRWTRNGRKFKISVDTMDEFFKNVKLPRFTRLRIEIAHPTGYVVHIKLSGHNASVLENELLTTANK